MALWMASGLALADDGIKVLEERGQEVEPSGTTKLRFEAGDEVSIHRILERGVAFGQGWSAQAETSRYLCTAPCTLEVPNGAYELRAGDNPLFALPFRVDARGVDQRWQVEDSNTALGVLGILGSGIGGGLALSGGLLYALDTGEDTGLSFGASDLVLVGLPMMVVGIWALVESFSSGEQLK
jgi:hypothetical protein